MKHYWELKEIRNKKNLFCCSIYATEYEEEGKVNNKDAKRKVVIIKPFLKIYKCCNPFGDTTRMYPPMTPAKTGNNEICLLWHLIKSQLNLNILKSKLNSLVFFHSCQTLDSKNI